MNKKWSVFFFVIFLVAANLMSWHFYSEQTEHELFDLARDYNERIVAATTTSLNAQLETIAIDARSTLDRIFNGSRNINSRVEREKSSMTESRGINAITLFKKDPSANNGWRSQFRLVSENLEKNPALDQIWTEIDFQTKRGIETAQNGKIEVLSFETSTSFRGLTLYAPYGPLDKEEHEQVLAIIIDPAILKVHPGADTEIFLVDREGRFLTDIGTKMHSRYRIYDQLEHLPIIQLSKHNRNVSGSMVYRPTPGQRDVIGSYQLVGYSGATVVSHIQTDVISSQLYTIDDRLLLICFTITMLTTAIYLLGSITGTSPLNALKRRHG